MAAIPSQPVRRTGPWAAYWQETRRPLTSLVFVAPLLATYELGVVLMGPQSVRNGADVWLRELLATLGFGQYFLLPALTCGLLLAWHHTRRERWHLDGRFLPWMYAEALALALILVTLARWQNDLTARLSSPLADTGHAESAHDAASRLIGYCGAGIYEELLFRLVLLTGSCAVLQMCGWSRRSAWMWSLIGTSVLFSAAHYQPWIAGGYAWDWGSFVFRFAAGAFFGLLFIGRGFGIAAAAHALYDVLVEVL